MLLFLIAFVAGVLTVLAPCVLPLLPVIVGGSVSGGMDRRRAYTVALSLGVSVILFTLLLKFSTAFIGIPQYAWMWFSGGVLILFGIVSLFPSLWDRLRFINTLSRESNKAMSAGFMQQNFWGDVIVGAALGPVFSTCSPTYFVILATVLPASFGEGLADLLSYTAGLVLMLLFVSLVGQKIIDKIGVAADPSGWFRKIIGALFIVVGVLVFTGAEQPLEAYLIEHVYDITKIEQVLLQARQNALQGISLQCKDGRCHGPEATSTMATTSAGTMPAEAQIARKEMQYPKAPEIAKAGGYINTDGAPITIKQFKGSKVVLIDFWTYSCINCQRTLPYLKAWYEKYHDQGLEIIGIHTPEFSFEHVLSNVQNAVQGFGIKYPVVLDNEYGTWNAFGNSYWPRKYLIDIDGFVVYDHAGEGNYDETEKAIQVVLAERAKRLGANAPSSGITKPVGAVSDIQAGSPETYFGSARNEYFASGTPGIGGTQSFMLPKSADANTLYFGGTWDIEPEYAQTVTDSAFEYAYRAKSVYLVAGAPEGKTIEVEVRSDGAALPKELAGADIVFKNGKTYVEIGGNRLYKIIEDKVFGAHTLQFVVPEKGLQVYTFTFG